MRHSSITGPRSITNADGRRLNEHIRPQFPGDTSSDTLYSVFLPFLARRCKWKNAISNLLIRILATYSDFLLLLANEPISDLKSAGRKAVGVQVPLWAPNNSREDRLR